MKNIKISLTESEIKALFLAIDDYRWCDVKDELKAFKRKVLYHIKKNGGIK